MNTINFLLAIHNHQPVGNFDEVFEEAYQHSYRPFLDVLTRHPGVRLAIHNSGCLIDWFEAHHPEILDVLGTLVARGQVEILTGGYYEPILPSIPEEDREGQVRKLSEWIQRRYGVLAPGLWLTERVWEPGLVGPLARAGVRYTMTDDSHFLAAGLAPEELWGHYLTEDQGWPLVVFPISKQLRYLIPFRPPEETITFLRALADQAPGRTALLGDDGEKFGVWPKTFDLVYTRGWLSRFFTLLEENADWIRLRLPAEMLDTPPVGKVYLPTASYDEMMEWALPVESQRRFHAFRASVVEADDGDERFVRGGMWRNFLARYPESNHMNKRMLWVRRRAEELRGRHPEAHARARDLCWAAQCNCAYWHGVFGGLYLPHLRNAIYEKILDAEAVVDAAEHGTAPFAAAERLDFDCDGDAEVLLRNPDLTVVISPAQGGAIEELSVKPLRVALGNGLTRRREAYHDRVKGAGGGAGGGAETASIHDLVAAKEEGLERHLFVDVYRRVSLLDHVLRPGTTVQDFYSGEGVDLGDFLTSPYEVALSTVDGGRLVSLRRTGTLWRDGRARRLAVEKRIALAPRGASLHIAYILESLEETPLDIWFGVEWNLSMLAGNSPEHRYRIAGVSAADAALASLGETRNVKSVALVDRHRGFEVGLSWSRPALLWRAPVETVSLSESGFERIYQSSALLPSWPLAFRPGGHAELKFKVEVKAL